MDIASRLKQLEEMVNEAKGMPLSSSVLLNREEVQEVLASMRDDLPEEIKQARWVVKDREELLAKARRDAEALIEEARAEQARLATQDEVARRAQEEAGRVLGEAREEARQIRLEAEDYVDQHLASLEAAIGKLRESLAASAADVQSLLERLEKTAQQVYAGRQKLAPVPEGQPEEVT